MKGSYSMANIERVVFGGVDTHKDVHVAAVIDERGKILDVGHFPTTTSGYGQLLAWLHSHGQLQSVGIEGTGSYGAGLSQHLAGEGVEVIEVNRQNRQNRRRRGKSDPIDAEAAARAVLNGEASGAPKSHDGVVESIRALRVAFTSARDARTRVALQSRDLLVNAPPALRAEIEPLSSEQRASRCARFRPGDPLDPREATKLALRSLARRYESLTEEMDGLSSVLDRLTLEANPALRAARGVGPDVAAILLVAAGDNPERLRSESAFAALCGVSPVQASSGKTVRHRLNRSGNRQANNALWRIAVVRIAHDEETRVYAARRTAEGKTRREIIRCLKRHIAREMFAHLTHPQIVPVGTTLRADRNAAKISLTTASTELGTYPLRISRIERGLDHDREFAEQYQAWLVQKIAA
jgi:transposase